MINNTHNTQPRINFVAGSKTIAGHRYSVLIPTQPELDTPVWRGIDNKVLTHIKGVRV